MVLTCTQIFAVLDAQSEQNQDLSPVLDVSSLIKRILRKLFAYKYTPNFRLYDISHVRRMGFPKKWFPIYRKILNRRSVTVNSPVCTLSLTSTTFVDASIVTN